MTKRMEPGDYAPGNMDATGDYLVGKGRPPESGKFRAGDNRKRGKRTKGMRNLATDLREELEAQLVVTVDGQQKKVSRQRAMLMRLTDNALKGNNRSISILLKLHQELIEPRQEQEPAGDDLMDFSHLTDAELHVLEFAVLTLAGKEIPEDLRKTVDLLLAPNEPGPGALVEGGD